MEFLALQYFQAVARYQNFTKAARVTYTSQPNISKQISQLEEELGVQLFRRTNAGAKLTPAGEFLDRGLLQQLPELERLFEETREMGESETEERIRLGLCESMDLEQIIPGFFSRLPQLMTPDIQLQIETHPVEHLLEKLAVDKLDCVFYFSPLRADISGVQRMAISRANPRLYYSTSHPLAQKGDLRIGDFSNAVFVRSAANWEIEDPHNVLPFVPKKMLDANSLNAAFLYIESGKAVGLFGPSQNRLGKEGICTLEVYSEKKVGTDVLWLTPIKKPALERFLSFLREQTAVSERNP